ncbi:transketolase, C-terminal section [Lachnospiraceae bacterium KM106-2]|nr:transketolase, C-terminal section [Lachnospiraceae bacterium KM106-2]
MKINSVGIRTWSRLGQRGAFFGIAMPEIAKDMDELKLLTADLSLLSGMDRFIGMYPEKFLNVGIAEQNMIGIAAGLAMDGKCVFASTYASFIAVRSLEHVRQHLAHLQCNVKIIGTSAGVVAAKSGVSHWATEDLAFMRALPNMTVLSAADSLEAIKMAEYAAKTVGPMYIRISGGLNCPVVYKEDYEFVPGKAVTIREGKDVAIIATGLMVAESKKAAELLEERGISCRVINMHTIKPIDQETLDEVMKDYSMIVTVEEHNVIGGLGSAVAEYKATKSNTPRQVFIGMQDCYQDGGSQRYVWSEMGITDEQIANRIEAEWKKEC